MASPIDISFIFQLVIPLIALILVLSVISTLFKQIRGMIE